MAIDPKRCALRVATALERIGFQSEPLPELRTESTPDILIDYHGIFVVDAVHWAMGLGNALHYAKSAQRKAVLLLVEEKDWLDCVEKAKIAVNGNTPPIQVWVLNLLHGTLDMGDGRTIEV